MGQAAAVELAREGWRVVLSGRREGVLEETAERVRDAGGEALVLTLDVGHDDIPAAARTVLDTWGRIDALVLAAGLNSPRRVWADQNLDDFDQIMQTNTVGPTRMIAAALPSLRETGGVVVVVSSYAAWTYHPMAGIAYSASKSALSSITRTLNSQEAGHGVRACHLCPGDVNTGFLELRPEVPGDDARAVMLSPDDIAAAIRFVVDAPPHVRVDELVISPISQV